MQPQWDAEGIRQATSLWRENLHIVCSKAKWKYQHLIEIQVPPQKQSLSQLYTQSPGSSHLGPSAKTWEGDKVRHWSPLGKFWRINAGGLAHHSESVSHCPWLTIGSVPKLQSLVSKHHMFIRSISSIYEDFPGGSDGKASVYNAGDQGSSPG